MCAWNGEEIYRSGKIGGEEIHTFWKIYTPVWPSTQWLKIIMGWSRCGQMKWIISLFPIVFAILQLPISLEPIGQFQWDLMKWTFANDVYNQSGLSEFWPIQTHFAQSHLNCDFLAVTDMFGISIHCKCQIDCYWCFKIKLNFYKMTYFFVLFLARWRKMSIYRKSKWCLAKMGKIKGLLRNLFMMLI